MVQKLRSKLVDPFNPQRNGGKCHIPRKHSVFGFRHASKACFRCVFPQTPPDTLPTILQFASVSSRSCAFAPPALSVSVAPWATNGGYYAPAPFIDYCATRLSPVLHAAASCEFLCLLLPPGEGAHRPTVGLLAKANLAIYQNRRNRNQRAPTCLAACMPGKVRSKLTVSCGGNHEPVYNIPKLPWAPVGQ